MPATYLPLSVEYMYSTLLFCLQLLSREPQDAIIAMVTGGVWKTEQRRKSVFTHSGAKLFPHGDTGLLELE